MENQKLYSPDIKFQTQLNYTNAIMQKVQELQFSLRIGKDCTREFSNLLFLLTDGIKKPIEPKRCMGLNPKRARNIQVAKSNSAGKKRE